MIMFIDSETKTHKILMVDVELLDLVLWNRDLERLGDKTLILELAGCSLKRVMKEAVRNEKHGVRCSLALLIYEILWEESAEFTDGRVLRQDENFIGACECACVLRI
jgi:hypothetical protein